MDYMNRKGKLSLQISAFSSIECLLDYINHNMVDILLIGEEGVLEIEKLKHKIKNIYVLSEGHRVRESSSYPSIYKFQSAELVMKEVFDLYMEQDIGQTELIRTTNCGHPQIIGVFSPIGGSKKTTFSLILSECYGMYKKTLYFNLELFCDLSWLHVYGKMGFSELIYYIKQKNPNLMMKLNAIVCNYSHFDMVPPVKHYQDLFELNQEDVNYFIHSLKEYSDYEEIIIDIGLFGKSVSKLLEQCDKVYIPTIENQLSKDKMEAFYRQMKEENHHEVLGKMEEVVLPYDTEIANESIGLITKGVLYNFVIELVGNGGIT